TPLLFKPLDPLDKRAQPLAGNSPDIRHSSPLRAKIQNWFSTRSMLRLRRGEGGLLLRRRFLLVLLAPFVIGHAVDDLARLGIAERDTLLLGRGAVPFL